MASSAPRVASSSPEQLFPQDAVYFLQPFPASLLGHAPVELELVETQEVPETRKRAVVVEEVRVGVVATERVDVLQASLRHTELVVEQAGETALPATSAS